MGDNQPSDWSVSAGRLRYDHRTFATRFTELRGRAMADGWLAVLGEWSGLSVDMVRHFAFEELAVFPGFARHKSGDTAVIRRLVDDHEALHVIVDTVTASIPLERVDARLLDDFSAAMDAHEMFECLRLYPWLELQNRRQDPRGGSLR